MRMLSQQQGGGPGVQPPADSQSSGGRAGNAIPSGPHSARHRWVALSLLVAAIVAACGALTGGRQLGQNAQAMPLWRGWNLVADPGGTVSAGPVYTLQANDQTYETLLPGTALAAGLGYWVPVPTYSGLPLGGGQAKATIIAPAGQWVMV